MKKSLLEIFEIILCLVMIAAVFMPFAYGVTPLEVAFGSVSYLGVMLISIPVISLIPLLFLLLVKDKLKGPSIKISIIIAIFLFLLIYGCYVYGFIEDGLNLKLFLPELTISLVLVLISFKFNSDKVDFVINCILAIIALPIILYMLFYSSGLNYGGWIIEGAFLYFTSSVLSPFLNDRKS